MALDELERVRRELRDLIDVRADGPLDLDAQHRYDELTARERALLDLRDSHSNAGS